MKSDPDRNIVYSQPVIEFVAVATEYCLLIESVSERKASVLVDVARKLLSLLYLKTSVLPDITPVLEEGLEKYVTELDYSYWLGKWTLTLGEYDLYYEVFDPEIQFGSETVTASIAENLMDIWQDLKDCISAYSLGDEGIMNDAIAECLVHFRDFWGQRLVNVLRALHQLWASGIDWDEKRSDRPAAGKNFTQKGNWPDRFFNSGKS
jgi:hypothetical protein